MARMPDHKETYPAVAERHGRVLALPAVTSALQKLLKQTFHSTSKDRHWKHKNMNCGGCVNRTAESTHSKVLVTHYCFGTQTFVKQELRTMRCEERSGAKP